MSDNGVMDSASLDSTRKMQINVTKGLTIPLAGEPRQVIGDANRYVDREAPWTLRKTDPERMAAVLYVLAETIRRLGIMAQPFVPTAAARILDQLALPEAARDFAQLDAAHALKPGMALPKPAGVFPRFVEPEGD